VDERGQNGAQTLEGTLQLTAGHRRRRSVYFTPPGEGELRIPTLGQAKRRDVERWVHREVQALTLAEDVDLISQHIIGVLRCLLAPG
jgi:hypothetical protein